MKVISDETDVFALLAFLYYNRTVRCLFLYIAATVNKWPRVIPMLPAVHALTGCDSTSRIFGNGKKTALNICVNKSLMKLGDKVKSMEEIIAEAIDFNGFLVMAYQTDSA